GIAWAPVAHQRCPFSWNGSVGQLRRTLGDPAGQLDVRLQARRIETRVEVAVLDRPVAFEDVAEVQTDRVAAADSVGQVAEALHLLKLSRAHGAAPAISVGAPPVAASTLAGCCREPIHEVLGPGAHLR